VLHPYMRNAALTGIPVGGAFADSLSASTSATRPCSGAHRGSRGARMRARRQRRTAFAAAFR